MNLTHFEERILWKLSEKPRGELITRTELNEALYGGLCGKDPPKSNSLEVIIGRMRRKGYSIQAVRGKGYVFQQVNTTHIDQDGARTTLVEKGTV